MEIKFDKRNYRKHDKKNKSLIKKSLEKFGAGRSIVVDAEGEIIGGNGVYEQAQKLGLKTKIVETDGSELVVVKRTDLKTDDEKRKALAVMDNSTSDTSEFDLELLTADFSVDELEDFGIELPEEEESEESECKGNIDEDFIIFPCSILDQSSGKWQDRKKYWIERLDINDNINSREGKLFDKDYIFLYPKTFKLYYDFKDKNNAQLTFKEFVEKFNPPEFEKEKQSISSKGISVFDPVLSELSCKWFSPYKGGKIFDCFAGDCFKGLVFALCGYEFTGIELRQEQVDDNINACKKFENLNLKYICDDGQNVDKYLEKESQDLLFSCPPYYNLEVYSNLPNDASNQKDYCDFLKILDNAYSKSIKILKDNRFAVIVVGNIRDKQGFYYNFINDIINIFNKNGMFLLNELILKEPINARRFSAKRYFKSRKIVKIHQNILVFYKGNPKKIKEIFPEVMVKENYAD